MEPANLNGFQSIISKLLQLYCAWHWQQKDEKAIHSYHHKSSVGLKLTGRKSFSRMSSSLQERF